MSLLKLALTLVRILVLRLLFKFMLLLESSISVGVFWVRFTLLVRLLCTLLLLLSILRNRRAFSMAFFFLDLLLNRVMSLSTIGLFKLAPRRFLALEFPLLLLGWFWLLELEILSSLEGEELVIVIFPSFLLKLGFFSTGEESFSFTGVDFLESFLRRR